MHPKDEMQRSHERVFEQFCKATSADKSALVSRDRQLNFTFFKSPVAFLPSPTEEAHLGGGVRVGCTFLQGDGGTGQRAVGTGEFDELECGLAFESVRYKSIPVPGLTIDQRKGILPNQRGRVWSDVGADFFLLILWSRLECMW